MTDVSQRNAKKYQQANIMLVELALIAVPIVVICIAVAINPDPSKSFVTTVVAKPEWYFISLVFCLEALRDRQRAQAKAARGDGDEAGMGWAIVATIVTAALAGLATHFSLAAPSLTTIPAVGQVAAQTTIKLPTQPLPLALLAIPLFLGCAAWSGWSRFALREVERRYEDDARLFSRMHQPQIYRTEDAVMVRSFYDQIATIYNERNDKAKGIRNAQNKVVEEIRILSKLRRPEAPLTVLDIGGGTGYNVYNSLRNEQGIAWTYVDLSPAMTTKFEEDFVGNGQRVEAFTCDFLGSDTHELTKRLAHYDVAVLSFSLTSMAKDIDFSALVKLLKPSGVVLIADIHPGYVAKSPGFDVEVGQHTHVLQLRKVETLALEKEALASGLERARWDVFSNGKEGSANAIYSFFMKLHRPEAATQAGD